MCSCMKREMSDGNKQQENCQMDRPLKMSPELNEAQKSHLAKLLRTFSGIFTKTDKSATARTNVKFRIHTVDHAPIYRRAHRFPPT
ncbi:hypothetical protein TNIN_266981 [Trichonephila inaurata madagascariensis]|uniref:Uncharacterized protein n=1 Tax=Trichonephila inaurata madagascariensis TaxID=2747483 RepID=A0A8X6XQH1_9ARAC|nr:hypothetical protein TNIN_266981 [Trichonephila inaurata madagascariensis]